MHTRGGKSDNEIENLNDDIISTEKYSRVAIEYFNIGDVPPLKGRHVNGKVTQYPEYFMILCN